MKTLKNWFVSNEEGQGMVEYGLIIALIAVAVIAALVTLGPKIAGMFTKVENAIPAGATEVAK